MFYLCSIGSNLDPHLHVSQAIGGLLERFGRLRLSSVIQTKPVGMESSHDFLNCLFVVESALAPRQLKALFIAMELAHGRDRSDPRCKVLDRPLDIDILANCQRDDFAATRVDAYLNELLAELYGQGRVHDRKVGLPLHIRLLKAGRVIDGQQIGLAPIVLRPEVKIEAELAAIAPRPGVEMEVEMGLAPIAPRPEVEVEPTPIAALRQRSNDGQATAAIYPDTGSRHVVVPHQ